MDVGRQKSSFLLKKTVRGITLPLTLGGLFALLIGVYWLLAN